MNILSLYDGMACGHIAFMLEEIPIDRYVAYEIDDYAVKTAVHNFPDIEQRGDVFDGDFTDFEGFDWLVGGSPCTYWSIAQKNNRETEASGLGWELFCQYVRALKEAKPKFFIYENNKSMSKAIRDSITEAFGFEPVCINSALVSAQNRQRLYWVGRRNDDGTYSKVDVPQPEDRGILLKDILEGGGLVAKDKAYCLKHQAGNARDYFKKHHTDIKFEPVSIRCRGRNGFGKWEARVDGKNGVVTANTVGINIAEPVRIPEYGTNDKSRSVLASYARKGCSEGSLSSEAFPEKQNKQLFDYIAEPVNTTVNGKSYALTSSYYKCGENPFINIGDCVDMTQPNSKTRRGRNMCDKSNCCMTSCQYYQYVGKLGYATPCEWDEDGRPIKAVSCADGKVYTVYEVKDGKITIKGKEYPIKLVDGFYIIRKLTVRECMRLQTVPEWYEFPVSDTQAYKMLGNGWTVEVIRHLIRCAVKDGEKND